jgi:uncharacterized protein (DUF2062 family)
MLPTLKKRVADPIVSLLTQGLSPEGIALGLAVGAVLGIFPALGWPSLLCLIVAVIFRLNLTALQIANFLVYPLQLVLLIPFMKLGEMAFRTRSSGWTLGQIITLIHNSIPKAIAVLWTVTIHAIAVWALLAAPLVFLTYSVLTPLLRQIAGASHRPGVALTISNSGEAAESVASFRDTPTELT